MPSEHINTPIGPLKVGDRVLLMPPGGKSGDEVPAQVIPHRSGRPPKRFCVQLQGATGPQVLSMNIETAKQLNVPENEAWVCVGLKPREPIPGYPGRSAG
jgi:hypothetical protein